MYTILLIVTHSKIPGNIVQKILEYQTFEVFPENNIPVQNFIESLHSIT